MWPSSPTPRAGGFQAVLDWCRSLPEKRRENILFGRFGPLFFTHVTQGLHTTLPYVLGVYMVRDYLSRDGDVEEEPDEEVVGWMTGVLGACFCAAQFIMSYPLGKLSDSWGRKPIVVLGNLSCVIGVLCFGYAPTYFLACLSRIVQGTFNAIIGAEKAMIGESLRMDQQAEAMGYFSLTWGVGTLLGPIIGGVLSTPCVSQAGSLFGLTETTWCESPTGLLHRKPYFLPCIVAAFISLMALVLTAFFMPETLPKLVRETDKRGQYAPVNSSDEVGLRKKNSNLGLSSEQDIEMSSSVQEAEHLCRNREEDASADNGPTTSLETSDMQDPWYRQRSVILSILGYASIAFCFILLDELIPIFASAPPEQGGLGFSPSKLSGPLAFGGVVLVVWLLAGYKWMSKRFGIIWTCKNGLWTTVPMALMFPLCSVSFLPSYLFMWISIAAKYVAGTNAFTSCIVLVNLVSPKESLGAVNGFGQTLASGVRALGPALGGIMWASSIRLFNSIDEDLWGHQFLPFSFVSIIALLTLLLYQNLTVPQMP